MKLGNLFLLPVFLVLSSCQKIFIKPDPINEPEKNFELFWSDINNSYPYFREDKVDWNAVYSSYRPTVNPSTTRPQLFNMFASMLSVLSDQHISLSDGDKNYFPKTYNQHFNALIRQTQNGEFSSDNNSKIYYYDNFKKIVANYLVDYQISKDNLSDVKAESDTVCTSGLYPVKNTSDTILYFNPTTFNTRFNFANLLLEKLSKHKIKAIVLDLRFNGGGSIGTMYNLMQLFQPVAKPTMIYGFVREKIGPLEDSYGPKFYYGYDKEENIPEISNPMVVLCNRFTISAAEHAVMIAKELKKAGKNVTVAGDYTAGALSYITQRTLPNQMTYTVVHNKTWDIDNVIREKIGIAPNITVYATPAIVSGIDEPLQRAFEVLTPLP